MCVSERQGLWSLRRTGASEGVEPLSTGATKGSTGADTCSTAVQLLRALLELLKAPMQLFQTPLGSFCCKYVKLFFLAKTLTYNVFGPNNAAGEFVC